MTLYCYFAFWSRRAGQQAESAAEERIRSEREARASRRREEARSENVYEGFLQITAEAGKRDRAVVQKKRENAARASTSIQSM